LHTSFGTIRLRLPDNANYDLSSHTTFGKVNSELPVTAVGVLGGDSLNGKINAGGCQLQLTNNNGSIEILRTDSPSRGKKR
jgi:hypothetical protein